MRSLIFIPLNTYPNEKNEERKREAPAELRSLSLFKPLSLFKLGRQSRVLTLSRLRRERENCLAKLVKTLHRPQRGEVGQRCE